jgi:hypothetical protein
LIRHDGAVPAESLSAMLLITAALAGFKLLAHLYFGLHRQTWHKIAFRDLRALLPAPPAWSFLSGPRSECPARFRCSTASSRCSCW